MLEFIKAFAEGFSALLKAGQDAKQQEDALKRAEERLALMRKRARYGKPGGG